MRPRCWLALALLVACSDPAAPSGLGIPPAGEGFVWANQSSGCAGNSPALSLPAARRDSLPPLIPYSFYTNDEWQRIAEHVPGGWAGMYYDGAHRLTLNFVDTTALSRALDSLAAYWRGQPLSFARNAVQIRVVRWDWIKLNDWYRYITLVAGLPAGVSFTDIQEGNNRLEFGAATAGDRDVLLPRLSELNAPCWLVAVTIRGYAQPLSARPRQPRNAVR